MVNRQKLAQSGKKFHYSKLILHSKFCFHEISLLKDFDVNVCLRSEIIVTMK